MKNIISRSFIYQVFSLLISLIIVHTIYVTIVRPNAASFLEKQRAETEQGEAHEGQSFFLMIRDYEQESCFILLLWALAIIAEKFMAAGKERALLHKKLVLLTEGMRILPEDTLEMARNIEDLPRAERERLLPQALLAGLSRFKATRNVQDVSITIGDVCDRESELLDSELSMVRYIAWAIPSIGFIGTVRGIGQALGRAHLAVEGDISQVTESLGVAFNSTLIALLISIVLMFIIHQLQHLQERYVIDVESHCNDNLIRNLSP